jgi:secreted trypsin-like serine protease
MFMDRVIRAVFLISLIAFAAASKAVAQCESSAAVRKTRIVPVGTASTEQWPWFAALRIRDLVTREVTYFCGGTAIDPHWILSAAHCLKGELNIVEQNIMENGVKKTFYGPSGQEILEIVLGSGNLRNVGPMNVYQVDRVDIHEDYVDAETDGNDIALLHISAPWKGAVATRAELPSGEGWSRGVIVAGFGVASHEEGLTRFPHPDGTFFRAGTPNLRHTPLIEASTAVCQSGYSDYKKVAIGPGQMCAGLLWNGADSCSGDSGGPLVAMDFSRQCPQLVGIVSWGENCGVGGRFGIYTRVAYYEPWIKKKTAVSSYLETAKLPSLSETQKGLFAQLEDALRPIAAPVHIELVARKPLKEGDKFVYDVTSEVDGKLILLNIDSTGDVKQANPTQYSPIGNITAGQKLGIPIDPRSYFSATPSGNERTLAVVVPEEFPYTSLVGSIDTLAKGKSETGEPLARIPIDEKDRVQYLVNLVYQVVKTMQDTSTTRGETKKWGYGVLDFDIKAK